MANERLGISFLDPNGDRKRRVGGPGAQGAAIQMLAMQLPRILGTQALAPSKLLFSQGGQGPTGLASVSPVGPRPSALADAISTSVINDITRSGSAGVGSDLLTRTGVPPTVPSAGPVSAGFDETGEERLRRLLEALAQTTSGGGGGAAPSAPSPSTPAPSPAPTPQAPPPPNIGFQEAPPPPNIGFQEPGVEREPVPELPVYQEPYNPWEQKYPGDFSSY